MLIFFFNWIQQTFPPVAEKDYCQKQQFFWWSSSKTFLATNTKMWGIWLIFETRSRNRAILFFWIWRKHFSAVGRNHFWFYFCATGGKDFSRLATKKIQIFQQLFSLFFKTIYTRSHDPFFKKSNFNSRKQLKLFLSSLLNLFGFW